MKYNIFIKMKKKKKISKPDLIDKVLKVISKIEKEHGVKIKFNIDSIKML